VSNRTIGNAVGERLQVTADTDDTPVSSEVEYSVVGRAVGKADEVIEGTRAGKCRRKKV